MTNPDDLREDALSGSVELPHVVRNEVAFLVCPPTPAAGTSCEADTEVPEKGFLNMWDNPARFTLRGWVPLYIPDATDASMNGPFLRTSAVHIGDTW